MYHSSGRVDFVKTISQNELVPHRLWSYINKLEFTCSYHNNVPYKTQLNIIIVI
jgi:hypothetical protein